MVIARNKPSYLQNVIVSYIKLITIVVILYKKSTGNSRDSGSLLDPSSGIHIEEPRDFASFGIRVLRFRALEERQYSAAYGAALVIACPPSRL